MTQTVHTFQAIARHELEMVLTKLIADGHIIISVCPTRDWTDPNFTNRYINDYLVVYASGADK